MLYAQAKVRLDLAEVQQEIQERKEMVEKVEGSGEIREVSQANDGWVDSGLVTYYMSQMYFYPYVQGWRKY